MLKKFFEKKPKFITLNNIVPLSKIAFIFLLIFDILMLATIFTGIEAQKRGLVSPYQYAPSSCRNFIESSVNSENIYNNPVFKEFLSRVNQKTYDNPYYDIYNDKSHPLCKDLKKHLEGIEKNKSLIRDLENRDKYISEIKDLQESLKAKGIVYSNSLAEYKEKMASNKKLEDEEDPNLNKANVSEQKIEAKQDNSKKKTEKKKKSNKKADSNKKSKNENSTKSDPSDAELKNKEAYQKELFLLYKNMQKLDSLNYKLSNNFKLSGLNKFLTNEQNITKIKNDVRNFAFNYEMKKTLMDFIFLVPLFIFAYFWNKIAIRKSNYIQTLVSTHFLIVVSLPIIVKLFSLLLDMFPEYFFKNLFSKLVEYNLIIIWYYLVIIIAIILLFVIIYFIQKRLFNDKRTRYRNIIQNRCNACHNKVKDGDKHCFSCGNQLLEECRNCGENTYSQVEYCKNCGYKQH